MVDVTKPGAAKQAWAVRWTATTMKPKFIERNLAMVDGHRYERRPSAIARKEGERYAGDVHICDGFEGSTEDWGTSESMPDENREEDVGWNPGAIEKPLPTFNGPKPGPTDPSLGPNTSEVDIMKGQLTPRFKAKVCEYTRMHAEEYRRAHPG